jgi:hypothetical protein
MNKVKIKNCNDVIRKIQYHINIYIIYICMHIYILVNSYQYFRIYMFLKILLIRFYNAI